MRTLKCHKLPPILVILLLSACSGGQIDNSLTTEVTIPSAELDTTLTVKVEDVPILLPPSLPPIMEARDWSLQDRALAFNPRLQELQESYDEAMYRFSIGDLLETQETLDITGALLDFASEDSLGNGLTQFYLSSLRTRMDLFQDILDEEAVMRFAASLEVADDSLLTLWYGNLPQIPSRPLEVVENERVSYWVKHFTGPGRNVFQKWLDRGAPYRPLIEETLARYDLPKELYFLAMIESGFVAKAKSSAGAVGPWQFIRGTGRRYGLTIDYWIDERRDFVRSTDAACQYLSHLHGIFQDWNLAMAGYNSGEFRVMASMRRAGSRNFWDLRLPKQTQDYVPKMMAATIVGLNFESYGFNPPPTGNTFRYEDITVDSAVDLSFISKKGNIKLSLIKEMNPHLLRWCTPPDQGAYAIHVPPGKPVRISDAIANLPREDLISFKRHKVKRGETLYDIAKGYGTTVSAIMRQNGIRNARLLRAGANLTIPTRPESPYTPHSESSVARAAEKNLPGIKVPEGQAKDFYTVRRGDNLSIIGQNLGVSVGNLQTWNGLSKKSTIYPQQVLQFLRPARSGDAQAVKNPVKREHLVRKGESLFLISRLYGATVYDLLDWNPHLKGKSALIHPGDRLVVFTRS